MTKNIGNIYHDFFRKAIDNSIIQLVLNCLLVLTICFVLIILLLNFNLIQCHYSEHICMKTISNMQVNLLQASAIIVSIIITFVVLRFSENKAFRAEKLRRFTQLQDQMVCYQEAMYQFGSQLETRWGLKPKYRNDRWKNIRDTEFSQTVENKAYACMFTTSLQRFGSDYQKYRDYETNQRILPKEKIKEMNEILGDLVAILSTQNDLNSILTDLGYPAGTLSDSAHIQIASDTGGLEYYAAKIDNPNENGDYITLEFWDNKINEAYEISQKLLNLTQFIHDYKSIEIKNLMLILITASLFGIFLPLLLISFNFNYITSSLMTFAALIGFLTCFIIALIKIFSLVTRIDIL